MCRSPLPSAGRKVVCGFSQLQIAGAAVITTTTVETGEWAGLLTYDITDIQTAGKCTDCSINFQNYLRAIPGTPSARWEAGFLLFVSSLA